MAMTCDCTLGNGVLSQASKPPRRRCTATLRSVASVVMCWALTSTAHAAMGPPGASDQGGTLSDIGYGSTGNVFQFQPLLFINGLGAANDPMSVVALNPALHFSWSYFGSGTGQMLIRYQIDNLSGSETFNDLRFMAFLNPDGEQATFLDRVSEIWGATDLQGPSRRETQPFTADPFDTIMARFKTGGNLQDLPPPAACVASAGCDATLGLQWNAATLAPQQRLLVTVSLSDNGQSLSSRSLQAAAANAAGTVLTVSGTMQVLPVPEAPAWAMTLAGLAMMCAWLRHHRVGSLGFELS
jgi:hypothetical protein